MESAALCSLLLKASNDALELQFKNLEFNDRGAAVVSSILLNQVMMSMNDYSNSYREQYMLFDGALDFVWEKLNTGHWCSVENSWRRLFTLISILKARTLLYVTRDYKKKQLLNAHDVTELNKDIVKICDIALIMGIPMLDHFCGKLANVLCTYVLPPIPDHDLNPDIKPKRRRHDSNLNTNLGRSQNIASVPYEDSLLIEDFVNNYKCHNQPVLIQNKLSHWPAVSKNSNRKWSVSYLKRVTGYRTVPIEIGSRYTDDDWTQTMMTVNDFVSKYIENTSQNVKGYLAQHNLFDQIPELRDDFDIPEYCYTGEDDSDDAAINIWFGPSETVSPLHTDPKHNCLCQIFGKKYVRLYTEDQSEYLSAFENGILSNTSEIDIEQDDNVITKSFPKFSKARGYECVLEEGDILYIPPKCWHFVKSLTNSCSLSFWFQ